MKIETTVVAEVVGTTMCCFDSLGQKIPTGAKVTVEWDDSRHECGEMKAYGRFLKRKAGIWFIMKDSRDGDWAVCEALYCPGCGKDLP